MTPSPRAAPCPPVTHPCTRGPTPVSPRPRDTPPCPHDTSPRPHVPQVFSAQEGRARLEEKKELSSFVIESAERGDEARYTIRVTNPVGEDTATILIKVVGKEGTRGHGGGRGRVCVCVSPTPCQRVSPRVPADVPDPPEAVRITSVGEDWAVLTWDPPKYDGGQPVTGECHACPARTGPCPRVSLPTRVSPCPPCRCLSPLTCIPAHACPPRPCVPPSPRVSPTHARPLPTHVPAHVSPPPAPLLPLSPLTCAPCPRVTPAHACPWPTRALAHACSPQGT